MSWKCYDGPPVGLGRCNVAAFTVPVPVETDSYSISQKGIPTMEHHNVRSFGIVREFDAIRGHGTIEHENGVQLRVRYSSILGEGVRILKSGDRVSFEVERSARGLLAVRVSREL
jgi:CspA family cold shock protein